MARIVGSSLKSDGLLSKLGGELAIAQTGSVGLPGLTPESVIIRNRLGIGVARVMASRATMKVVSCRRKSPGVVCDAIGSVPTCGQGLRARCQGHGLAFSVAPICPPKAAGGSPCPIS